MEPVRLSTERLELSAPTAADVDAIALAVQDPEIPRWTTLPSPYVKADAAQFVDRVASAWRSEAELTWAIRREAVLIGMIGLHRVSRGGAAEIGYWLAESARGQGFLTEAGRAIVDFGFAPNGLGLARIEWRAIVGNVASARVAHRLGFRYEGLLRLGLSDPRGRHDGWIAGLLATDDRRPQAWPVLEA